MHCRGGGAVRARLRGGAAALFLLFAASGAASAKLRLVATVPPIYDWVRQVGGGRVEVHLLLPPGASPHTFSPTPRDVKAIARAALLFRNGLGLEAWAEKLVRSAGGRSLRVVTLAEGLGPLRNPEAGSGRAARHLVWDPHVWLDPVRARAMVLRIGRVLGEADPANAEAYRRRAAAYAQKLKALDAELRAALAPYRGRSVVTHHGSFGYLLARYGIRLAAVVEPFPGKEPTPRHLRGLVGRLRRLRGPIVFAEPQFSPKAAEVIAREAGGRVVLLDPLGGPGAPGRETYLDMMRWNLRRMRKAFGG